MVLEKVDLVILVIASMGKAYVNYINYFWVPFIEHISK